jgi:hypothetical protein
MNSLNIRARIAKQEVKKKLYCSRLTTIGILDHSLARKKLLNLIKNHFMFNNSGNNVKTCYFHSLVFPFFFSNHARDFKDLKHEMVGIDARVHMMPLPSIMELKMDFVL